MDDVLLNKASTIERYLQRINEEYLGHEDELETNFTRQDSIILNLQRACESSIDAAMHLVRVNRLGVPQQSREAFSMLSDANMLDSKLASDMQAMVGFRNVAVHDYRKLNINILRAILQNHLDDFRNFAASILKIADK